MNIALWVVQGLLAAMFLYAGGVKAFQYPKARETLNWVRHAPKGFVIFVGLAEVLGAVGLVLPPLVGLPAILTPLAAAGLALTMLCATAYHLWRREPAGMTVVLGLLAAFVVYGRWPA